MNVLTPQFWDAFRFWSKVDFSGDCWTWSGHRNRAGYGSGHKGTGRKGSRTVLAHRRAYELRIGPIVGGSELDHLCRVRPCVNPDHLEPVSPEENKRRQDNSRNGNEHRAKTHCPKGHEYTPENTRRSKRYPTHRDCIECKRASVRAWRERKAASRAN